MGTYDITCVLRPGNNFVELVLSFYFSVGSGDEIQVVRLAVWGGKSLYLLSHLAASSLIPRPDYSLALIA